MGTTSSEVLFLCLARNCAPTLPGFFAFLRALRGEGLRVSTLIGENGSIDATARLIEEAAPDVVERVDTSAMAKYSERLRRMAIGRQLLLDRLRNSDARPRYVCVADLDGVMNSPPPASHLAAALRQLDQDQSLFAVGATSRPFYYDLLSLRLQGFESLCDLHDRIQRAKRGPLTYYQFQRDQIYAVQRAVTSRIPVRCVSSFNGMCIYRGEDYLHGSYRSPQEKEVCEHVAFNLSISMTSGKLMLISQGLVLQMPPDHVPVGFGRFWLDRLRKKLS